MQWCLNVHQTRERSREVIFVDEKCANGRIAFHQKSSDFEKKCNIISEPEHTLIDSKWIYAWKQIVMTLIFEN